MPRARTIALVFLITVAPLFTIVEAAETLAASLAEVAERTVIEPADTASPTPGPSLDASPRGAASASDPVAPSLHVAPFVQFPCIRLGTPPCPVRPSLSSHGPPRTGLARLQVFRC